jgi:hypothetical protein
MGTDWKASPDLSSSFGAASCLEQKYILVFLPIRLWGMKIFLLKGVAS